MTSYVVTLMDRDVPTLEQELTQQGLRVADRRVQDDGRVILVVEDVTSDALAMIRVRVPESRWTRDFL